jgi:hypothetical protein
MRILLERGAREGYCFMALEAWILSWLEHMSNELRPWRQQLID